MASFKTGINHKKSSSLLIFFKFQTHVFYNRSKIVHEEQTLHVQDIASIKSNMVRGKITRFKSDEENELPAIFCILPSIFFQKLEDSFRFIY